MRAELYNRPAKVENLRFEKGRRILVVSDIHGNDEYFCGVLEAAGFSERDELIINGDFSEKGPNSLKVLHRIMKLSERGNVHTILGNCDDWYPIFRMSEEAHRQILDYIQYRKSGLLWEMLRESGFDPLKLGDLSSVCPLLYERFQREWDFIAALPEAIESENFIFAHAGADPAKPLREHCVNELVKYDRFLDLGRVFSKWLIVGHYPVMLYRKDIVCANPIIDRKHHIVSIDGACVLKDDGQLNCLILPDNDSEDFSFVAYDGFPEVIALDEQSAGERSTYVAWDDSTVQVLLRGEEFSRCRHLSTGYELDILTKYLFSDDEITRCNDCTDYILPVRRGDRLKLVETTSRGYFVKKNGVSGWYYGRVEIHKPAEF